MCGGVEGLGDGGGGGVEEGGRLAGVAAPLGVGVEGDAGEEGDVQALCLADSSPVAEEVVAGAVFALEP